MAEYFRRHPELLQFQVSGLRLRVFGIILVVRGAVLDLRNNASAAAVGISPDRLHSSDADEDVRYRECRELAVAAIAGNRCGIAYPSAAAAWATWNLVVFGDPDPATWESLSITPVVPPVLAPSQVNALSRLEGAT
jgi:hypothetical protein